VTDKFKVFISWSGDLAKAVATVWKDLLKETFDVVEPFMSEENIGAGERGLAKIATELANTGFGIIVVTQDNQHSQWLNYEAGALSKNIDDGKVRVAPSLVDFARKNDVTGPLGQFQGTLLTKVGVGEILAELARVIEVDESSVEKRFQRAWELEYAEKFDRAKESGPPPTTVAHRETPEMLDEILTLVREIARTNRPTVDLTKPAQPSRAAIREAMISVLGDEYRWRARRLHRRVDVTVPDELAPDVQDKLTLALGNVPYVDIITIEVAPNHFFDDPEPELD
jgi:hypothetical protein